MNWKDKGIINPWANVCSQNVFAADDYEHLVYVDKKSNLKFQFGSPSYVEAIKKQYPKSKLRLKCLPSPYSGSPDANVYCLNMNPGEPDSHFDKWPLTANVYTSQSLENLKHNVQDAFWTDDMVADQQGNVSLDNDVFNSLLGDKNTVPGFYIHGGARWQRLKTKELWQSRGGQKPNIFFLEYFPYHSKHGFDFPDYLPSYDYRNALLEFAMDEDKLIIIMRSENKWYDINGVGKRLKDYKKKILLRNCQGGWLSRGNMIQFVPDNKNDILTWKDIINLL